MAHERQRFLPEARGTISHTATEELRVFGELFGSELFIPVGAEGDTNFSGRRTDLDFGGRGDFESAQVVPLERRFRGFELPDEGPLTVDLASILNDPLGIAIGAEQQQAIQQQFAAFRNPESGLLEFPSVAQFIRESQGGQGDVFPGESGVIEGLTFVIQSGDLSSVRAFENQFGPISELQSPGSATEPGGEDRTIAQTGAERLAAARGELPGGQRTQAAFRSRVGRGRGSTILGGLGDEEKTTILGG